MNNMVVFGRGAGSDGAIAVVGRSEDPHAVEQGWWEAVAGHDVQPSEVVSVEAMWEPSPEDTQFIAATFGDVPVNHLFPRPRRDEWLTALREAREVLDTIASPGGDTSDDREESLGGWSHGGPRLREDEVLLPLLHSTSLPATATIEETIPGHHI
jgi:hypothetical protein